MPGRLYVEQDHLWSSQSDDLSLAMWALAEELATERLDREGFLQGLRDVLRLLEAEYSPERLSRVEAFAADMLMNLHLLPFDAEPLVPLVEKVSALETVIDPASDIEQVNGKIEELLGEVDLLMVEGE
jgi:hypothetical protein